MKKRIVTSVLLTALIMGSLQGCGKSDSTATSDTAAEAADTTEAWDDGYVTEEAEGDYVYDYEAAAGETEENTASANEEAEESYLEGCYTFDFPDSSGEEYSEWEEKGYASVRKEPLSTFSADVDTASYSNLRRLIRSGYSLEYLPDGAARIEEMLNYFSYDYNEPEGSEPFGVTTQISSCPWNEEAQLLMIGLKTQSIDYEDAPSSNLVFLLDVSGSMYNPDKLPLLQESFCMLAENLTEKDRVSIVTYAGEDTIVLDGVSGDKTKKIQKALMGLEAGGGTYGSKGIETAYELAQKHFIKGGNNRIILATDGDLNIGMTTEEELEELITEKKESGIFLSVLGFGTGNIKDNKMETLADKGNGNYSYIDCLTEAKKVLVEEMSATLLTVCKDVKLQVEFNPAVVSEYRLIGYENRALNREDFEDDTKDAGEIGAGHSVTVLYELILKEPLTALSEEEIEGLKYSENYKKELEESGEDNAAKSQEWLTLSVRYKKPAEEESNLLQYPVSFDSFKEHPSDDFRFAAAVAEFGLLASHSEYPEDASVKNVRKTLKAIELGDEYKKEFLELVEEVLTNK
ncbi:MAG: von Willebrand factor type A domain-containing protein [Lachnospiraceae bacterium]|nr:von Willebrand factor type A domain-containing protein [Lachnospiraceae bacterium]